MTGIWMNKGDGWELERIVGYLDRISTHALTIDLISLNVYEVNGVQVALPQRVTPDLNSSSTLATPERESFITTREGLTDGPDGPDVFRASFADIVGESRKTFEDLTAWALQISSLPNVRLFTFSGIEGKRFTLLPRIMPDSAGLVTIWNDEQRPSISVWRSVFDRLAPESIESVERAIAPTKFGQGNTVKNITAEVLKTLKAAYEEAARK